MGCNFKNLSWKLTAFFLAVSMWILPVTQAYSSSAKNDLSDSSLSKKKPILREDNFDENSLRDAARAFEFSQISDSSRDAVKNKKLMQTTIKGLVLASFSVKNILEILGTQYSLSEMTIALRKNGFSLEKMGMSLKERDYSNKSFEEIFSKRIIGEIDLIVSIIDNSL